MRAARVLMNLGRASALGAGRRRGADMEAWNRSRRTLLRARDAAERAGVPLGDEALGLEAMMGARERSEREHGVPLTYEPGETAARDRPDSYFVGDPAARAGVEAKETAAGGYDPARQERANRAYREQISTVSRGYGAPPAPKYPAPQLKPGATYAVRESGAPGSPMVTEVPGQRMRDEAPLAEGTGYARLEGYPAPSMEREQRLGASRRAFVQAGSPGAQVYEQALAAGATEQQALDAVTAVQQQQAQRAQMQAAGETILPAPQTLAEIGTDQTTLAAERAQMAQAQAEAEAARGVAPQMAAAALAAEEAAARGAGAQATFLEGQSLPAQRMLELWQTPEGKQQVMAEWATASQQQKQAYAA